MFLNEVGVLYMVGFKYLFTVKLGLVLLPSSNPWIPFIYSHLYKITYTLHLRYTLHEKLEIRLTPNHSCGLPVGFVTCFRRLECRFVKFTTSLRVSSSTEGVVIIILILLESLTAQSKLLISVDSTSLMIFEGGGHVLPFGMHMNGAVAPFRSLQQSCVAVSQGFCARIHEFWEAGPGWQVVIPLPHTRFLVPVPETQQNGLDASGQSLKGGESAPPNIVH